jgi:DNA repair exonuclease SbcCD nuclease subunit
VLVIHGDVEGVVAHDHGVAEYGGAMVTAAELGAEHWSYVAFGHYHVQREIAPRAWYAGSLEYVSTNPWAEMREEALHGGSGKGWLLADLETGAVERMQVPLARRYIDLPRINGAGLGPEELDRKIAERLSAVQGGIGGQVVRLVLTDVPRTVARLLDHTALRAVRADALHFHLDLRRPEPASSQESGAAGRRATLAEIVQEYLERRRLPEGLDRAVFVQTGVELVETAERNLSDG